jgi:hypothetical protein
MENTKLLAVNEVGSHKIPHVFKGKIKQIKIPFTLLW